MPLEQHAPLSARSVQCQIWAGGVIIESHTAARHISFLRAKETITEPILERLP